MNGMRRMGVAIVCMGVTAGVFAQAPADAPREGAVPLTQLISIVAKQGGRKFVIDPRVRADVLIVGQDASSITYAGFLTILQVHGFAAVEGGGYVRVVPEAYARQMSVANVTGKEAHADAEYVSRIIPVGNMPAAMLVPILRPLLPQQAHLVAVSCSNVLMIVDTFGNVKRIETLVQALDVGEGYQPEKCGTKQPVAGA